MKIKKEEKMLIRAYVNFMRTKYDIGVGDAAWLESEITSIINNKNIEYRYMVEEYIIALIAE